MGRPWMKIRDQILSWEKDRLYIKVEDDFKEFPTVGKRQTLIERIHESNMHIGSEKLYEKIQQQYYWPLMLEDCYQYVRKCLAC